MFPKRTAAAGCLALLLAVPAVPAHAQQASRGSEEPTDASDVELAGASVVLEVDGMSCPFCAYGLEKRLLRIPSVDALVVRVSDGLVRIRVKEGETLTDEALAEAVKRAGFSLREIRRVETPSG